MSYWFNNLPYIETLLGLISTFILFDISIQYIFQEKITVNQQFILQQHEFPPFS